MLSININEILLSQTFISQNTEKLFCIMEIKSSKKLNCEKYLLEKISTTKIIQKYKNRIHCTQI